MRVRDVEIALVLAREMKGAAARDVEASLRLQQLKEVFGAEELDRGERARIQTALQMAGLEPQPSLLDAALDEPIRFAVTPDDAAAAAPAAETATGERQEFPTVGEFTRSTLRRFRRRRSRDKATEVRAAAGPPPLPLPPGPIEHEEPAALEPEPEPEPEPAEEPLAEEPVAEEPLAQEQVAEEPETGEPEVEEPEAFDEEAEQLDEAASGNGHVDPGANGHSHIDLEDAVLPPHDTATPADFGASAETIDFDDPRLEEELAYEAEEYEHHESEAAYEPEPEPEPVLHYEPDPYLDQPAAAPEPPAAAVRAEDVAAVLLPAVAIPVLVGSIVGWTFGLAFVALSLIATGVIAGRRGGFLATLRSSPAARTVLKATLAITAVSLAIGIVLANVGTKGSGKSSRPAAQTPAPAKPKATPTQPQAAAPQPKKHRKARSSTTPQAPAPDPATSGLYRVSPGTSTNGTSTTPSGTSTTPSGTTTTP